MDAQTTNGSVELTLSFPANLVAQADRLVESGALPSREAVLIAALEAYLARPDRRPAAPTDAPPRIAEARAGYLAGEAETERWTEKVEVWTAEDEARLLAEAEKIWAEMEADWQAELETMRRLESEELTPEVIERRLRELEETRGIVKLDDPDLAYDIVMNPALHEWSLNWDWYGPKP